MKPFHILLLITICAVCAVPALPAVVQDAVPVAIRGRISGKRLVDEAARIENELAKRRTERAAEAKVATQSRTPRLDEASLRELEERRRVGDDLRAKYASFLKADHTGIFKLFPDNGCGGKSIVSVAGACAGFVPDSSFYSFRAGEYLAPTLADIGLVKGHLVSKSFFTQSIMVSLGDADLSELDAEHPAVRRLVDFKPRLTPNTAEIASRLFSEGLYIGPYIYAESLNVSAGPAFAIRKIEFKRSGDDVMFASSDEAHVERSLRASLNYSDRKDTTYVFRVAGKDEDGSVTVLWKQVSRKDAPAIDFKKGDKFPNLSMWKHFRPAGEAK